MFAVGISILSLSLCQLLKATLRLEIIVDFSFRTHTFFCYKIDYKYVSWREMRKENNFGYASQLLPVLIEIYRIFQKGKLEFQ